VCGIAAVLDPEARLPDRAGSAMVAALRHRGPDGEGVSRLGPAVLVHTRLAIVDVEGGRQPLSSEDGAITAIVNGEIYNHEQLRGQLEQLGHRFATRSDSEAIVHAYEQWGVDCLPRLNGIFAFALWDGPRRRLVAARDPFGVKPLYWCRRGDQIGVASEVGALMAAGLVHPELDPIGLDHLLAWRFVPAPRTLFRAVSKLAPASYLVAEGGDPLVASYRQAPGPPIDGASADELAAELRREFVSAVTRQTMADVPYAAFLSGGIDSAAIVSALRRGVGAVPSTFTIGFPGFGEDLDESAAAADSARVLCADHHLVTMGETDYPADVAAAVERLEEPCGSAAAPALFQLSRFTARSVKVVLSGQGADEPLGGYRRAQAAAALSLLEVVPAAAGGPLGAAAGLLPRNERAKRAAAVIGTPPGLDRLVSIFEISSAATRAQLLRGPGAEAHEERRGIAAAVLEDVAGRDLLDQALYLDTRVFLPDHLLLYGDKMSMASGLEHRVPFLDHELMRLVERIPGQTRMRFGQRKWLYRRSMRELVPPQVMSRPKRAFTTPYDQWLRTSLAGEIERAFTPGAGVSEHVDPTTVHRLVDEHRRGRADHKRVLYCLLELAYWHRAFPEGTRASASLTAA